MNVLHRFVIDLEMLQLSISPLQLNTKAFIIKQTERKFATLFTESVADERKM